jgi:L-fuculose-phosphate aldolase
METAGRRAIVAACRRLHAQGFIGGGEGNVSMRLPSGDLLITPAGADKATLMPEMLVCVHPDGTPCHDVSVSGDSAGRPSSEVGMHLACYRERPEIRAVVHAHPPVATGFATAGLSIPADVLPEFPAVVGPVALVPYARPGTGALGDGLAAVLPGHDVFLLANHGVTTVGQSLEQAMQRMESVEQGARILLVARLLGGEQRLPPGEAAALAALRIR